MLWIRRGDGRHKGLPSSLPQVSGIGRRFDVSAIRCRPDNESCGRKSLSRLDLPGFIASNSRIRCRGPGGDGGGCKGCPLTPALSPEYRGEGSRSLPGRSPDQNLLLSADLMGNINLLNLATGKIERTLKNRPFDYINTVAFTPNGKQFAVGGSGGQVVFYDTGSGKELKVLKVLKSEMTRMAISPDGR